MKRHCPDTSFFATNGDAVSTAEKGIVIVAIAIAMIAVAMAIGSVVIAVVAIIIAVFCLSGAYRCVVLKRCLPLCSAEAVSTAMDLL